MYIRRTETRNTTTGNRYFTYRLVRSERIGAQLLAREAKAQDETPVAGGDLQRIDADSMELMRPRRVGVESAALWAMQQVNFTGLLQGLGFTGPQRAAALGSVIGRLA